VFERAGFSAAAIRNRFAIRTLLDPASFVFLIVGASWLLLATLRREVLGFSEPIVLLTAVHFHMAGFATAVVAMARIDSARSTRELAWARAGGRFAIAGPACVAIGHLTIGELELVGAIVMTIAVLCLSAAAFLHSPTRTGWQRGVLRSAAFVPLITMTLALHYALNRVMVVHPLSYQAIAAIHGFLNVTVFLSGNLVVSVPQLVIAAEEKQRVIAI
jgi:hypothetical protein